MTVLNAITAVPKGVLKVNQMMFKAPKAAAGVYLDLLENTTEKVTSYQRNAGQRNGDRLASVMGAQANVARKAADLYVSGGRKLLEYDVRGSRAAGTLRTAGSATKDIAGETAAATKDAAGATGDATKRTARQARKVPGVARAEGQVKGAVASEEDLAIARYDSLNADEITSKLGDLSQIDLAKVEAYERKNENRTTVMSRISSLRGDEPWPGYDELTVAEIQAELSGADDERAKQVRAYERTHKNRAGVINAAERESSSS